MSRTLNSSTVATGPMANWDPRWKFAALFTSGACVLFIQQLGTLSVAFGMVVALLAASRMLLRTILVRFGFVLLGVAPAALLVPFTNERGWELAATIVLRALILTGLVQVAIGTTKAERGFAALHRMGVPGVLVRIVQLAVRYAFDFGDELRRRRMAHFARGFRFTATGHAYRTLGQTAGSLLVRGADRSEQVGEAMRARGFDGRYHSAAAFRTGAFDVAFAIGVVAAFAALLAWDRFA